MLQVDATGGVAKKLFDIGYNRRLAAINGSWLGAWGLEKLLGIRLFSERFVQFWEERFGLFSLVEHLYLGILRDLSIYALGKII